jgi:hypothetical protein
MTNHPDPAAAAEELAGGVGRIALAGGGVR